VQENVRETGRNRPREDAIVKPFSRAGTEPQFAELLADPITQLVMRRDGITEREIHAAVEIARRALAAPDLGDTGRPAAARRPSLVRAGAAAAGRRPATASLQQSPEHFRRERLAVKREA
jgi:hypothetical protein